MFSPLEKSRLIRVAYNNESSIRVSGKGLNFGRSNLIGFYAYDYDHRLMEWNLFEFQRLMRLIFSHLPNNLEFKRWNYSHIIWRGKFWRARLTRFDSRQNGRFGAYKIVRRYFRRNNTYRVLDLKKKKKTFSRSLRILKKQKKK